MEDDINLEYFKHRTNTFDTLLEELKKVNGVCLQLCLINFKNEFNSISKSKNLLSKGWACSAGAYLITRQGMKDVLDTMDRTKQLNVSEKIIFREIKNYMTKPYFSYHFLSDMESTIRNYDDHSMQTDSKRMWDNYYKNI